MPTIHYVNTQNIMESNISYHIHAYPVSTSNQVILLISTRGIQDISRHIQVYPICFSIQDTLLISIVTQDILKVIQETLR